MISVTFWDRLTETQQKELLEAGVTKEEYIERMCAKIRKTWEGAL